MNVGFIKAFGRKAITIETNERKQYIANLEDCDKEIIESLTCISDSNPIMFDIDNTRFSGENIIGKRYYAINVKFYELII